MAVIDGATFKYICRKCDVKQKAYTEFMRTRCEMAKVMGWKAHKRWGDICPKCIIKENE